MTATAVAPVVPILRARCCVHQCRVVARWQVGPAHTACDQHLARVLRLVYALLNTGQVEAS